MIEIGTEISPRAMRYGEGKRPFRILLLGNFSGRNPDKLRARQVDPDNLDDVLSAIRPRSGSLEFTRLEHFHPDEIYERMSLFQKLARSRLNPPALSKAPLAPAPVPPGGLLDAILAEHDPAPPPTLDVHNLDSRDWDQALQNLMAAYTVPAEDPGRKHAIKAIDAAIAQNMRAVLHDPAFQSLEAAWRSVDFLVRRLEIGSDVSLHIADVTPQTLVESVTGLIADSEPWSVIVGLYSFKAEQLDDLGAVGRLAGRAGTEFLTSIEPSLVNTGEAWREFRRSPESQYVGVALPRFLLRLPYGHETNSVDGFEFEEMPEPPVHDEYLWGNGAVPCAYLLAARSQGEQSSEITGMPVHTYKIGPDSQMTPCAETWITDRMAEKFMEAGVMPLVSARNRDSIWVPNPDLRSGPCSG